MCLYLSCVETCNDRRFGYFCPLHTMNRSYCRVTGLQQCCSTSAKCIFLLEIGRGLSDSVFFPDVRHARARMTCTPVTHMCIFFFKLPIYLFVQVTIGSFQHAQARLVNSQ